jgi:hypothetical protein
MTTGFLSTALTAVAGVIIAGLAHVALWLVAEPSSELVWISGMGVQPDGTRDGRNHNEGLAAGRVSDHELLRP